MQLLSCGASSCSAAAAYSAGRAACDTAPAAGAACSLPGVGVLPDGPGGSGTGVTAASIFTLKGAYQGGAGTHYRLACFYLGGPGQAQLLAQSDFTVTSPAGHT